MVLIMKIAMVCDSPVNRIAGSRAIALVCDSVSKTGGSQVYRNHLTYHISHMENIELHIVMTGEEDKQFRIDNLIIHTVKERKIFYIPFLTPILLHKMVKEVVRIDPDVVHAISSSTFHSTVVSFLRNRYPTLLTIYGIKSKERKYRKWDYKNYGKGRLSIIVLHILAFLSGINERYVISRIPNIIVEASSIGSLISKWTNSRIYVVPSGIEYGKIQNYQLRASSDQSPDVFIVAGLQRIKGVDLLINAITTVVRSIPGINVGIAGSGPQESELKSLVRRLNLDANVNFLGYVSEEEKYRYYKACKIVVVPSRWDCQPITLFEAAASGKPVIASDMSNPGIVEDGVTGLIFESEHVKDLADRILTLLTDDELRETMGNIAKERVKEYDWSKIAERTVEVYEEVIADF